MEFWHVLQFLLFFLFRILQTLVMFYVFTWMCTYPLTFLLLHSPLPTVLHSSAFELSLGAEYSLCHLKIQDLLQLFVIIFSPFTHILLFIFLMTKTSLVSDFYIKDQKNIFFIWNVQKPDLSSFWGSVLFPVISFFLFFFTHETLS